LRKAEQIVKQTSYRIGLLQAVCHYLLKDKRFTRRREDVENGVWFHAETRRRGGSEDQWNTEFTDTSPSRIEGELETSVSPGVSPTPLRASA
jgi:hypothetical protein